MEETENLLFRARLDLHKLYTEVLAKLSDRGYVEKTERIVLEELMDVPFKSVSETQDVIREFWLSRKSSKSTDILYNLA